MINNSLYSNFTYTLNNPLKYTDPSGYKFLTQSPAPYPPDLNETFDYSWTRLGGASSSLTQYGSIATLDAGPSFGDVYFVGADGELYRRDRIANEIANASTFSGPNAFSDAMAYYKSTLPPNHFNNYYSDQDNWDSNLLASNDDDTQFEQFIKSMPDPNLSLQNREGYLGLAGALVILQTISAFTLTAEVAFPPALGLGIQATAYTINFKLYNDYLHNYVENDNKQLSDRIRFGVNTSSFIIGSFPLFSMPALVPAYLDHMGHLNGLYKRFDK